MATLQELERAFIAADDAGNKEDASVFAAEIRRLRAEAPAPSPVMRKYRIETDRGVFEIEANREPTAEEVQQLFAGGLQAVKEQAPQPAQAAYRSMRRGLGPDFSPYIQSTQDERTTKRAAATAFDATAQITAPSIAGLGGPGIGSAVGGAGETLVQIRRKLMGEQPDIREGEIAKAAALNAIPLAKARGMLTAIKNAIRLGAGGVAAEEARSVIDDGKMASAESARASGVVPASAALAIPIIGRMAAKLAGRVDPADAARIGALAKQNALEDKTLKAITDRGGVVAPSLVGDSRVTRVLESIAGPTNLENAGSKINSKVFNAIGREEASIPGDVAMDSAAFIKAREKIAGPAYAEVEKLGFGDRLKQWREANNLAQRYSKELAGNYTVAGENLRDKKLLEANKILDEIKAGVTEKGRPDIADALEESRIKFAKNYDVEKAVNEGSGDMEARVLAAMLKARGEKGLTDGLGDVARFQRAFPDYAKPRAGMPGSPSAVTAGTSLLAASGAPSAATAVMAGGVPLLRGPIRDMILSPGYQRIFAKRNYSVPVSADPAIVEIVTRAVANTQRSK